MIIAVINTDEQPIEAIRRELGDIIDNCDSETYSFNGEEFYYYPIDVKQMPLKEVTIYKTGKI